MAARNRPRAPPKDENDVHEERDLWSRIVNDLHDLARRSKQIQELNNLVSNEKARLGIDDIGGLPTIARRSMLNGADKPVKALEKLYVEQLRLANEEQA
jgi:hypothetical protein